MLNKKGFTLLELMVVIIIIAILVVIAIPTYSKAVERGRCTEAYTQLGAMRNAQARYVQRYGSFAPDLNGLVASGEIDEPNITGATGKSYFSSSQGTKGGYSTDSSNVGVAKRNTVDFFAGIGPQQRVPYTITMQANGDVSGGP